MGLYQATAIIGGMSGSLIGAIAAENHNLGISDWYSWRVTLSFPAMAFLKIAGTWFCFYNLHMDTQHLEK